VQGTGTVMAWHHPKANAMAEQGLAHTLGAITGQTKQCLSNPALAARLRLGIATGARGGRLGCVEDGKHAPPGMWDLHGLSRRNQGRRVLVPAAMHKARYRHAVKPRSSC
jgi:hypothetical protein